MYSLFSNSINGLPSNTCNETNKFCTALILAWGGVMASGIIVATLIVCGCMRARKNTPHVSPSITA